MRGPEAEALLRAAEAAARLLERRRQQAVIIKEGEETELPAAGATERGVEQERTP